MDRKAIEEKLVQFLLEIGLDEEDVKNFDDTTEQIGLSSIELIDLAGLINDEYGINMKLINEQVLSLNQICDLIIDEMSR